MYVCIHVTAMTEHDAAFSLLLSPQATPSVDAKRKPLTPLGDVTWQKGEVSILCAQLWYCETFRITELNEYLSHSSYDLNSHMTVCITCTYMYTVLVFQ